jgi:hypothetical protein
MERHALAGLLVAPDDFAAPIMKRRLRQILPRAELTNRKAADSLTPKYLAPKPILHWIAPRSMSSHENSHEKRKEPNQSL